MSSIRYSGPQQTSNQKTGVNRGEVYQSAVVGEVRLDAFHERGYHKRFLGQDLDVVCFLLACEVERLYEDAHVWKNKYEQLHAQNLDRMHYDTHIAELTNKLNESEANTMALHEDNIRLREELQNWEQRYVQMVQSKDKEIEALRRRIYELEQEVNNQKTIIVKNGDLQGKIDGLEKELQNWRNIATERGEKNQKLMGEVEKLSHQNRQLDDSCRGLDSRVKDQNKQINDLIAQIRSLEDELHNHANEQKKHQGHRASLENDNKRLTSELEELRNRYNDLLGRYNQLIPYPDKCKSLEERVVLQETEISNLRNQISDKNGALQEWQDRYTKLEIQLAHYRQFEDKLREAENRIAMLTTELERLNNLLNNKMRECDEWKHKAHHGEGDLEQLSKRFQLLQKENEDLRAILAKKDKELDDLRREYAQLQAKCNDLHKKNQEHENRIVLMTSEVDRLNTVIKNNLQQIENFRNENHQIRVELQAWKAKEAHIIELENKIAMLVQELENLRNQLSNKSNECEEWKGKFYRTDAERHQLEDRVKELENRLVMITQELERHQQLLGNKDRELQELRGKLNDNHRVIDDLERIIATLKQKIAELEDSLRRSSEEINSWKQRNMELQNRLNEYRNIEIELAALQEELERLQQEKEDLERLNRQLQQHLRRQKCLRRKVGDLTVQIVLLFAEIEALRMRVRNKEKEVDDVRRSSLQPIKNSVKQRISNLNNSQFSRHM